jgi:hypothetical protein
MLDPTQTNYPFTKTAEMNKFLTVAVGPSFQMTKDFRFRADYELTSVTQVANATAVTSHSIGLSGVYKF